MRVFLPLIWLICVTMPSLCAQKGSSKEQLPKGQMPRIGRPTKDDDKVPPFNFDEYFTGEWRFEWDVPEGPLGPSGHITGTIVYKPLDGNFYEATIEGLGPAGPFTNTELIAYHKDNKTLARYVTVSSGYSYLQIGSIGGDLGGYYTVFYESAPFAYMGRSIRMKSAMRLLSPISYRVATSVSVDGGPFSNYGSSWWQKHVPTVASR